MMAGTERLRQRPRPRPRAARRGPAGARRRLTRRARRGCLVTASRLTPCGGASPQQNPPSAARADRDRARRPPHQGAAAAAASRRHRRPRPPRPRPRHAPRRSWTPGSRPSSTSRRSSPAATPRSGPVLLAEAGILLVDRLEGRQHVPRRLPGAGPRRGRLRRRQAGRDGPGGRRRRCSSRRWTLARTGLAAQLETFTHNSSEFLRREEALLLHGQGLPAARRPARRPARDRGRATGKDHRAELQADPRLPARAPPGLIGVDGGADALREAGHTPDVVILDNRGGRAALGRPPCAPPATSSSGSTAATGVPWSTSNGSASGRCGSRPPPPPRTSRCCSPTPATPRSSSGSARTPRSTSSSTGSAPAWPAPT